MMEDYYNKYYKVFVREDCDSLRVKKSERSEWCDIEMEVNENSTDRITIRSKIMAEHLHFMLGQLLEK